MRAFLAMAASDFGFPIFVSKVRQPDVQTTHSRHSSWGAARARGIDYSINWGLYYQAGYDEYSLLDLYSVFFYYSYPTRQIYYSFE